MRTIFKQSTTLVIASVMVARSCATAFLAPSASRLPSTSSGRSQAPSTSETTRLSGLASSRSTPAQHLTSAVPAAIASLMVGCLVSVGAMRHFQQRSTGPSRTRRRVVALEEKEGEVDEAEPKKKKLEVPDITINRKMWKERVKYIEGDRIVFEVSIKKPLGLIPANFPGKPGVGVAKIKPDSNVEKHNLDVLVYGKEAMFVMEGDEVIGVDGTICEGQDLSRVGALVKGAKGDEIRLKLVRNYNKGPVKVVWLPGLHQATMKRGTLLRNCAEAMDADVKYRCKDGWCSSCWHVNDADDLVYRICQVTVPDMWDNTIPMIMLRADTAFRKKGILVKNMMQADGALPPGPLGAAVKDVRKAVENQAVEGKVMEKKFIGLAEGNDEGEKVGWIDLMKKRREGKA